MVIRPVGPKEPTTPVAFQRVYFCVKSVIYAYQYHLSIKAQIETVVLMERKLAYIYSSKGFGIDLNMYFIFPQKTWEYFDFKGLTFVTI